MSGSPLTVLQLSWSLLTGGLERVVVDIARRGGAHGLRTVAAALEKAGPLAEELEALGAPFFLLGKRPGLDARMVPRLVALMRRERVDVVHAHNQAAALYGGLAALYCRRPLVITRHGASYGRDLSHLLLGRAGALLARGVVCVGREACEVARRVDGVPGTRLRLIYNGVDAEAYRPDPQARAECRRELGLADAETAVLSVGRLSREKDYGTLLRAMARLRRALPGCRLLMAGGGAERESLERKSADLKLEALWLGERRDVPRLLAAADIFALSSLSEGVSIAVLEAMAAGLPVVATQVGGNRELVEPGRTGILVPPANSTALARALEDLARDPLRARLMGLAGRERARAEFGLETMVGAYAALYRQVARRKDGGS